MKSKKMKPKSAKDELQKKKIFGPDGPRKKKLQPNVKVKYKRHLYDEQE